MQNGNDSAFHRALKQAYIWALYRENESQHALAPREMVGLARMMEKDHWNDILIQDRTALEKAYKEGLDEGPYPESPTECEGCGDDESYYILMQGETETPLCGSCYVKYSEGWHDATHGPVQAILALYGIQLLDGWDKRWAWQPEIYTTEAS